MYLFISVGGRDIAIHFNWHEIQTLPHIHLVSAQEA